MLQTVVNPYNSLYMACCYLIKIYFKNWGRTNQSTVVVQNSYEWVTWACTASKCMAAETNPLGWWKGLRVQQCLVKINQVQSLTYESVAALSVHWLRPTVYVGDGINGCELPLQFRYTVTLRHDFPQVMVHSRNIQFSHMQYCLVSCTHLSVIFFAHLLKSFSVSSSSSPWPRRRRWRSSMSRAMIFSKSWFKAWCGMKKNLFHLYVIYLC